jgi:hypothetical protein
MTHVTTTLLITSLLLSTLSVSHPRQPSILDMIYL